MTRWKTICAYDGTSFPGWQSQQGGKAIQDVIEERLAAIFGRPTRIHGSGRTDSGVHAVAQVFHFEGDWPHGERKLAAALRHRLDRAIQIVSVRKAPETFHARFSVTGKTYVYHIFLGDPDPFTRPYCWSIMRPLDLAGMRSAARALQGTHDFKAFSGLNRPEEGEATDTVRDLRKLKVSVRGRRVRIEAEANGFLYKMVRRLVGALVGVGEGKLSVGDIKEFLASGERSARVQTAPAQGLFLQRVRYR